MLGGMEAQQYLSCLLPVLTPKVHSYSISTLGSTIPQVDLTALLIINISQRLGLSGMPWWLSQLGIGLWLGS